MAECMNFPATVEEFMEQYKITDTEQVYTNGIELVPIFRMKQWFEHQPSVDVVSVVRCKNCARYLDLRHWCKCHDTTMFENDFCSYGARREEQAECGRL